MDLTGRSDLTDHWAGVAALSVFVLAYALVLLGERAGLRKSKPVILGAGLIWVLIAIAERGEPEAAASALRHNLLDFAEVFLFVLAAMTYINTLEEIGVFRSLRAWLVSRGFSMRGVFWVTGALAFFSSPVADNLTTALFTSAAVIAVAEGRRALIVPGCINVVVAANAGGAFCPFGDITTLLVWQKGVVAFHEFFALFLPALVNWLIPAWFLSRAVPADRPAVWDHDKGGHDPALHDTGHQNAGQQDAEHRDSGIGRGGVGVLGLSPSVSGSRSRAIICCTCHRSSG